MTATPHLCIPPAATDGQFSEVGGQLGATLYPELHVDLLQVIVHCPHGYEEPLSDLAARQILGGEEGYLSFAI